MNDTRTSIVGSGKRVVAGASLAPEAVGGACRYLRIRPGDVAQGTRRFESRLSAFLMRHLRLRREEADDGGRSPATIGRNGNQSQIGYGKENDDHI